jgi:predicted dehydrogenase
MRHGHMGTLDPAAPAGLMSTFNQIPGVHVVALCEADQATLAREGGFLPGARRFGTVEALLEDGGFDFAVVGLPAVEVPPTAVALLRRGKHCFLEKSVARTAAEFRPVEAASRETGAHVLVDFPWRHHPAVAAIRRLLDEGTLGRPLAAAAHMVTTQVGPLPGQRDPRNVHYLPATEGGGMLHWLGGHFLEVLLFLMGDVREVCAMCAPVVGHLPPDPRMDDVSEVSLRFAGGALGSLYTGYLNAAPGPNRDFVHVWGTDGDAYWPSLGPQLVVSHRTPEGGGQTRTLDLALKPHPGVYGNTEWMFQLAVDFVRGIREGRPPAVGAAEAIRVMEVTDAAYEASRTRRWVTLRTG